MLGLVKHESKDPEVLMVTGWQQQEGPESHSLAPRSFPPSSAPRAPPPNSGGLIMMLFTVYI